MRVRELINLLKQLPQEKIILAQLVATQSPEVWTLGFDFFDTTTKFVQLRVEHPMIKKLPLILEENENEKET